MQRRINVIDMYHGNAVALPNFAAMKENGLYAIVHKATQGNSYKDPLFANRIAAIAEAGLLPGAYHFLDSTDPRKQADNFIKATFAREKIPGNLSIWADYEDYRSSASLKQLMEFITAVETDNRVPDGVQMGVYSGNRIRETLRPHPGGHQDPEMLGIVDFFQRRRLWMAQYGPRLVIPWPWNEPIAKTSNESAPLPPPGVFMWQFTETGRFDPLIGKTDGNFFDGTFEQLQARWLA